jgi:hypothetical protein
MSSVSTTSPIDSETNWVGSYRTRHSTPDGKRSASRASSTRTRRETSIAFASGSWKTPRAMAGCPESRVKPL